VDEVSGVAGLARAELAVPAALPPGEERDVRARGPLAVAEVEVVGARVVVVHGALDELQAERPDVEVGVVLRVASDGRDVVESGGGRHTPP
jgi:hypothetical protein